MAIKIVYGLKNFVDHTLNLKYGSRMVFWGKYVFRRKQRFEILLYSAGWMGESQWLRADWLPNQQCPFAVLGRRNHSAGSVCQNPSNLLGSGQNPQGKVDNSQVIHRNSEVVNNSFIFLRIWFSDYWRGLLICSCLVPITRFRSPNTNSPT